MKCSLCWQVQASSGKLVRRLIGSSAPACGHACGACSPCKIQIVNFECSNDYGSHAEACPLGYLCICHGKAFPIPWTIIQSPCLSSRFSSTWRNIEMQTTTRRTWGLFSFDSTVAELDFEATKGFSFSFLSCVYFRNPLEQNSNVGISLVPTNENKRRLIENLWVPQLKPFVKDPLIFQRCLVCVEFAWDKCPSPNTCVLWKRVKEPPDVSILLRGLLRSTGPFLYPQTAHLILCNLTSSMAKARYISSHGYLSSTKWTSKKDHCMILLDKV